MLSPAAQRRVPQGSQIGAWQSPTSSSTRLMTSHLQVKISMHLKHPGQSKGVLQGSRLYTSRNFVYFVRLFSTGSSLLAEHWLHKP